MLNQSGIHLLDTFITVKIMRQLQLLNDRKLPILLFYWVKIKILEMSFFSYLILI